MAEVHKARGLAHYGDINPYQFSGKWERTEMFEDPHQTYNFYRDTLKDFSPEVPAQASDFARRSYENQGRLTLRHTGTRSGLDPENPDLFLGFTDRDNRGHLLEPNGDEWKRQSWHRKAMFEPQFRDDSDWSVPSQGIHPNTMYAQIRATQPWLQSRFRNFETSRTGWHNGGPVEIPHASLVDKSCGVSEKMNCKMIDTELRARQHKTTLLSNNFNMGWRSGTDHKVKVAQYGKIYRGTPMMEHTSQLSYISPDQKLSNFLLENKGNAPKSTVVIMSAATSNTAASEANKMRHLKGDKMAKHLMGLAGEPALEATVRGLRLSDDIMRVLGYVHTSAEFGGSWVLDKAGKTPDPHDDPERIRRLTKLLHKEPANIQLQVSETIKRIYGGGLLPPSDRAKNAGMAIVNPKIIDFMANQSRSMADPTINGENKNKRLAEGSEKELIEKLPMYVPRKKKSAKITEMLHLGEVNKNHRDHVNESKIKSYKSLKEQVVQNNRQAAESTQLMSDTSRGPPRKTNDNMPGATTTDSTSVDHSMHERGTIDRRGGLMGGKYNVREMDTDTFQGGLNNI